MSYALITDGGTDGRYTIYLDYGEAQKAALLAQLATAQATLTTKIAEQQVHVDAAEAAEAASLNNLQLMQESIINIIEQEGFESLGGPAKKLYDYILNEHRKLVIRHQPVRDAMRTLKSQLAQATAMMAYWNSLVASETRSAWCCDLTEDATGYVATVEIPGEANLILIAPGGREPALATDGLLTARELMSPAQAYFNAAILPGWQRHMPTYRWATIDTIHNDGTVDITFGAAVSSAQRLNVNDVDSLKNVSVSYMTCGAGAFSDGDRCIVHFTMNTVGGPSVWTKDTCQVIGFLDNPKRCGTLRARYLQILESALGHVSCEYRFLFADPADALFVISNADAISCSTRINGGSWFALTKQPLSAVWTKNTLSEPGTGSFFIGVSNVGDFPMNVTVNSIPEVPALVGDILEFKFEHLGEIIHNAAVQLVDKSGLTPFGTIGGFTLYGGGVGFARTKTAKNMDPTSPNEIMLLTGYQLTTDP